MENKYNIILKRRLGSVIKEHRPSDTTAAAAAAVARRSPSDRGAVDLVVLEVFHSAHIYKELNN